jgi:hypothetical protein
LGGDGQDRGVIDIGNFGDADATVDQGGGDEIRSAN